MVSLSAFSDMNQIQNEMQENPIAWKYAGGICDEWIKQGLSNSYQDNNFARLYYTW